VMHELTEMTRTTSSAGASKQLTPEEIAAMAREKPATGSGGGTGGGIVSSTLIAGRFDVLTKKIELLLEAFETSIAGTQKMTELLGFGPRMKELSERTLEELKAISSRNVEQQKTLQDLIDVNVEGARTASYILEAQRQTKEISEGALGALKNLTLGVAEQHQLTQQIVDVEGLIARTIAGVLDSQKQVKEVGDQTLVELKSIAHGQDEQRKLAQNLVDIGGKTAFAANDILDAQRQGKAELASLLQSLGDRIVKMEEASVGGSRHVWEIKENFIKLCKNVGMMDLIASGVGGQTMLLETLVEEARGTQRVLVEMHEDMRGQTPNGR